MQTEKRFTRALKALGGPKRPRTVPGGRWVLVPPAPDYPPPGGASARPGPSAADRRRRNLSYLAVFILVTFVLGLFPPLRALLLLNLIADILLVVYLGAALYFAARPVTPPADRRPREANLPRTEAAGGHL